jgi:hypothetical protein
MPSLGAALALSGTPLGVAIAVNFMLGALMTLGAPAPPSANRK